MINNDWDIYLREEFSKEYFKNIISFLNKEHEHKNIYPAKSDIFKALELSSYENTKLVILGQDPYYNFGQANGLAFSVNRGVKIPPSLKNIFKELESDLSIEPSNNGDLSKWASQGVLLLNTSLSVEEKKPNSHRAIGWQKFTDKVIKLVNDKDKACVFFLWGNNAKAKESLITNPIHKIIKSSHPSPLSARISFFGSKPFSKANDFLREEGREEINWNLNS